MGKEKWTRHVIINTQPKDEVISNNCKRLFAKPMRVKGQERTIFNWNERFGIESKQDDKVYVMGHGGDNTLGGIPPEHLAQQLSKAVKDSNQINVVMCGSSDVAAAKRFAKELFEKFEYKGTVYAYASVVRVAKLGKKLAGVTDIELMKLGVDTTQQVKAKDVVQAFDQEFFKQEREKEKQEGDKRSMEGLQGELAFLHNLGASEPVASDGGGESEQDSLL